jgi:putative nucleotidyltransferase with HDIG domain
MVGENGTVPFAAVYHRNTSKSTKILTGPELDSAAEEAMSVTNSGNPASSTSTLQLRGELERLLVRGFGVQFTLLDGETGAVIYCSAQQPKVAAGQWSELCRAVSRRRRPEFLAEEDPFLVLALPVAVNNDLSWVAVGTFLTRAVGPEEDLSAAAKRVGLDPDSAAGWARTQTPWTARMLERLSRLMLEHVELQQRVEELKNESNDLSVHLAATYEEISLLHRLTRNLRLSQSDEELGRGALEWLDEVIPARGFALQLIPVPDAEKSLTHTSRTTSLLLIRGACPVDEAQFTTLMEYLEAGKLTQPLVLNQPAKRKADWPFLQIQQMMAVSLAAGENLFGYLAAFNHVDGREFGTVEASLMNSVAAILGIHSGNIDLYRQQSELLTGIVRALTSAIDAKDQYTCGHSDRVARVAVRLAQELGCDAQTIHTIYLAGLLHDIGKIGVEDNVLLKPDKLSSEEYERIKSHVEIGHHILHDLNKLEDILPVVLHHHEAWDGSGYPHQLDCEKIPLAARIIAVADAFDAMSSDRPYRAGMSPEMIERILTAGAGKQWDPEVVAVFFRARKDISQIAREKHSAQKIILPKAAAATTREAESSAQPR